MTHKPFDLARVRRNWERAVEPLRSEPVATRVRAEPPRDAHGEVRALFGQIRAMAEKQLPEHAATLAPFFSEAERLLEAALSRPAGEQGGSEKAAGAAKAQLQALLSDLEDMLEVVALVGR